MGNQRDIVTVVLGRPLPLPDLDCGRADHLDRLGFEGGSDGGRDVAVAALAAQPPAGEQSPWVDVDGQLNFYYAKEPLGYFDEPPEAGAEPGPLAWYRVRVPAGDRTVNLVRDHLCFMRNITINDCARLIATFEHLLEPPGIGR